MSGKRIKIAGFGSGVENGLFHKVFIDRFKIAERPAVEARFSTTGWKYCLTVKVVSASLHLSVKEFKKALRQFNERKNLSLIHI